MQAQCVRMLSRPLCKSVSTGGLSSDLTCLVGLLRFGFQSVHVVCLSDKGAAQATCQDFQRVIAAAEEDTQARTIQGDGEMYIVLMSCILPASVTSRYLYCYAP